MKYGGVCRNTQNVRFHCSRATECDTCHNLASSCGNSLGLALIIFFDHLIPDLLAELALVGRQGFCFRPVHSRCPIEEKVSSQYLAKWILRKRVTELRYGV